MTNLYVPAGFSPPGAGPLQVELVRRDRQLAATLNHYAKALSISAGNYVTFNQAGWIDLLGNITVRGTGAAANPTWAAYRGNIYQYQFSNAQTNEVWVNFHWPHGYKPASNVYIHAHWSQNVADAGKAVKWSFDVSWAKGFDQAAFSSPITLSVTQNASSTQYRHMVAEVQLSATSPTATQLDSDDLEVDGVLMVRVWRDPTDNADTLTQVPFLHFVDIHMQADRISTPNRSPSFY